MDPLSISMAILQTFSVITATIKAAKSVYNAPEELESLLNDLTEGEIMVLDVKYHLGQPRPEIPPEVNLEEKLSEAECILLELKSLVEAILSKPQDPKSIRQYTWFKARKKTRKLRSKLAQIHQELPKRLGQVEGSRIKLELTDISLIQKEVHSGLSRVEHIGDITSQRISNILEVQERHTKALQQANELQGQTLHHLKRLESTFLVNTNPQTLPGTNTTQESKQLLTSSEQINVSSLQSTYQSLMIQTRYRPRTTCSSRCCCRCHHQKLLETPSFLSGIFGQMFVHYKGLPFIPKSCSENGCKLNSEPSIYAIYFFPRWWIIDRLVIFTAKRISNLGPELILRFPTYIPYLSEAIVYIERGYIDKLRQLFADGAASPNDLMVLVTATTTIHSLLDVALRYRQFSIMRYLVQAGATFNTDETHESLFADTLCRQLFGNGGGIPDEHRQWITETLISHRLQELEFSGLHETLLNLRYTTIEEETLILRSKGSTIDVRDSWDYTALHWACARGDRNAIIQLLEFGADPNAINVFGETPLHKIIASGDVEYALHLLNNGADACYITKDGWNAVLAAIRWCGPHPSIIELLDRLEILGADINAKDERGTCCFTLAIGRNYHQVLRWLLKKGANYRNETNGDTILHGVGFLGDLQTIEIFREARLSGFQIHAMTQNPMDEMLHPLRSTRASGELIANFTCLLSEIEARTNGITPAFDMIGDDITVDTKPITFKMILETSGEDSSDEQDFVDSVEVQIEDPGENIDVVY